MGKATLTPAGSLVCSPASQWFLQAEQQLHSSMQGFRLLRQGELRVYHLSLILPKSPSVNDFLWIWHNYLLLQQRDAMSTRIPNCHQI